MKYLFFDQRPIFYRNSFLALENSRATHEFYALYMTGKYQVIGEGISPNWTICNWRTAFDAVISGE